MDRSTGMQLRSLLEKNAMEEAVHFSNQKDFYRLKESMILQFLEKGTLQHFSGDYKKSLKNLTQALMISRQLFTVAVSKKIISMVAGDGNDQYYPKQYENSLIRFYITLNQFLLSQDSKIRPDQQKKYLQQAKSSLLEWDSFQNDLHAARKGTPLFKKDILSNLLGAIVHRQIKTKNDRSIAMKLLDNSQEVFFQNSNMYLSFNSKAILFLNDFKTLHTRGKKKIKKDYVRQTAHSNNLTAYIQNSLKQDQKTIHFLIQESWIAPIKPKTFIIPLFIAGDLVGELDLGFLPFATSLVQLRAGLPFLSYELPKIVPVNNLEKRWLVIRKEGVNKMIKVPLALVAPLSDISYRTFQDEILVHHLKVGSRLVVKHIAALATAYLIYKKTLAQSPLIAKIAGMASYTAFRRFIASSERADLRKWISLPKNIFLHDSVLTPGNYEILFQREEKDGSLFEKFLSMITVGDQNNKIFYNFKI